MAQAHLMNTFTTQNTFSQLNIGLETRVWSLNKYPNNQRKKEDIKTKHSTAEIKSMEKRISTDL